MADISKIKLPDGSEFNIKDAAAARSADLAAVATSGSYNDLSSTPTIPTKTSDLTNDSDYQTEQEVNTLISSALENINTFNVAIVTTLPTQNIDTHTIYFLKPTPAAAGTAVVGEAQVVSENSEENNEYIEWMYINNQWERLGTTSVDLSGYVETSRKINNKALTSDINLTAADVGAIEESDLADVAFSGSYNDLVDTLPIARGEGENSLVENNVADPWYDEKYTIYITGSGSDFTYTTEDTLPIINSNKLNRYILVDGSSYRKINSIDTTNQTIVIEFNYAAQTDRQVFIYHIVGNVASQNYSHAEGRYVVASGEYSHAEGSSTKATALGSHTEGSATMALSSYSHAEGFASTAKGVASHVEGYQTIANGKSQHVFGEYNIEDTTTNALIKGTYVEIVGNGTSSARSNARTLDWSGNETLAGKLTVGAPGVNSLDAATVGQLPTKTSDLTNDSNFQTTTNLVTTLSSSSTDTQYPSAKAVYDAIAAGGGGGSSPVTYTYTDPNNDGNIIISQQVLGTLDESQF